MAQLTDDCFAFGGKPMRIEEAVAMIAERFPVVAGTETVPLGFADGRIAAEDVFAGHDLPPFANAAVDGYAVRFADLEAETETVLPVSGRLAAGAAAGDLPSGTTIRIFTGAPMPPGADTVFMQEDVRREGDRVVLPAGLKPGANARPAGEDLAAGGLAIPAGRRLRPQDLALAAATGHAQIAVRRRLRVAVFSTGDELTEPGAPLRPGAIHDSNRVLLVTLLTRLGVAVDDLGILRDDPVTLPARLAEAARDHDLILTSGGVSTGEEDHVKTAVDAQGRLMLWRLAIKPGRPVAVGLVAGTPFVGLPGNPVAVYITLLFVVRPLLARLGGARYEPPLSWPVRAGFSYRKKAGRREFVRVSLVRSGEGDLEAQKFPRDGAGVLTSLTESDGLVELPDDATGVSPGDLLAYYPHVLLW
ncbi:UNVERIFIED_ORG: molybdopterin molybdotransferase [Methylobacterium sp. SuP10 SLI 274]|uniref:molybdopterin molybdotransferase MoeA n=1 Tax=Methylorubrum extorquens TaxID=408 RepID=UPI0020A04F67|nr:gephyrin-like molybdotransferase Glp [Methylorubrum extorquens]MDF9864924.1 molybdopterin molybdotransferase [Methylorubrum pseudosasae]MDH6638499.1 molybdopterin molybdotransferase [Methylobacterium sp. SuP10 SLI 274]MDH6667684.1 molybdopterin molybdotransferase [Methylorubrum zatmanii]MCP1559580.1 molybdopterin molybdotransferase [Methylorubrum extorquens]MDF9793221.1 molybdopterin molybdotransferase [Methylorubrum extorquens]